LRGRASERAVPRVAPATTADNRPAWETRCFQCRDKIVRLALRQSRANLTRDSAQSKSDRRSTPLKHERTNAGEDFFCAKRFGVRRCSAACPRKFLPRENTKRARKLY